MMQKERSDIDDILSYISHLDVKESGEPAPVSEGGQSGSLVRKPTVKKSQISISEGYLFKKKVQLGRVYWVKRYFKIHETLLLYTRKDSVSCLSFRPSFLISPLPFFSVLTSSSSFLPASPA